MNEFITIKESVKVEIVEKKSKFIANLFYAESISEAEEIIKKMKKEYFDARHNCIAYRIIEEETIIEKSSDDGEPSGTAGAPMLNILQKNNLCNVVIIVTRYFGGILLGTGGLVRAYSEALKKALEKAILIKKVEGEKIEIELDYSNFEGLKYCCRINNINIVNIRYLENIFCEIEVEKTKKQKLLKDLEVKNVILKNIDVIKNKFIVETC